MNLNAVGIDIAKHVFQICWVDPSSGELINKQVKRASLLHHFANRERCLIGMEACGGAQHWARKLIELGHEVRIMAGKTVKAFVTRNKNDAADAKAIWLAVQQPVKCVSVKTEAQQGILALHRMRQQLIKFRTMQINGLRGLLAEFGEVMGVGRAGIKRAILAILEKLADRVPASLIESLREQWGRILRLDEEISAIEQRLKEWLKEERACKVIAAIPGIGLLTATAAVATMANPHAFKSGREFAAFLGLVPGQTGTGGKTKLLGISKRGDTYLRTLLIHGARSVLLHQKVPPTWLEELQKRRPSNVVVVALANKMARTIWALLAHGRTYQSGYVSCQPCLPGPVAS
ncbi:IS110 family transposase [Phenylobacterium sp.]|uniref:IS110 family transposase n=1 Tax=Phenylobacterium sp. TaxID=1871053 RepID=UPI0027372310|nr:IS110 family transposase [Phenylobacterium sp.]MDP3660097.1 IS110 family transposase [Phenylobacterium sp.]